MNYLLIILCYLALCLVAQLIMSKEYDFVKSNQLAFFIRPLVGLVCVLLVIASGDAVEWVCDKAKKIAELCQDFFVSCGVFVLMIAGLIILAFFCAKKYALNFLGKHHFKVNLVFAISILAWFIWLIANFILLGALALVVIYTAFSAIILINSKEKSAWSLYPGALLSVCFFILFDIFSSFTCKEEIVESVI